MPTAQDYRDCAALCVKLAEAAFDPAEVAILKQIATQFRRLANREAKRNRGQEAENSS
jgi:hypothetical protein